MDFCFSHYIFLFVFLKNQTKNKRKYCKSELYYPLQQPTLGNVLHRAIVSKNPNPNQPLSPSSICRENHQGLYLFGQTCSLIQGLKKAIAMSLPSTGHGNAFCEPLPCRHHPLRTLSPSSSTTQIWVLCCWHNRLIRHRSTPTTPKEKPSHWLHPISTTPLSADFLTTVRDVLYLESSEWFFSLCF